jgi:uncharacterized protein (TIGR02611 family)
VHSFRELLRFILRTGKRAVILVVGLVLLAGGLVMMVTPGPGILLIIAGLAVLATEFAWAEVMLDRAKEQATKAKDSVWSRLKRRRSTSGEPATDRRQK